MSDVDLDLDDLLGSGATFRLGGQVWHLPPELALETAAEFIRFRERYKEAERISEEPPEMPELAEDASDEQRAEWEQECNRLLSEFEQRQRTAESQMIDTMTAMSEMVNMILDSDPRNEGRHPTLGLRSVNRIVALAMNGVETDFETPEDVVVDTLVDPEAPVDPTIPAGAEETLVEGAPV